MESISFGFPSGSWWFFRMQIRLNTTLSPLSLLSTKGETLKWRRFSTKSLPLTTDFILPIAQLVLRHERVHLETANLVDFSCYFWDTVMGAIFVQRDQMDQTIFSCEKQLYKRLCPSVGPSVCRSVRGSVGWSRVSPKPRIQVNSSKIHKIQQNSTKFNKIQDFLQLLARWRPCSPQNHYHNWPTN